MAKEKLDLFNHNKKKDSIEEIRFNIENLLSADNLLNPDSVKILQHVLNRFVAGEPILEEDGMLGPLTMRLVQQYRNENRYWKSMSLDPKSAITIDPVLTSMAYDNAVEKQARNKYIEKHEPEEEQDYRPWNPFDR